MNDGTEEFDEGCGYFYDHKTVEDEQDGLVTWTCTECGAEGFEDLTDSAADASDEPSASSGTTS